MFFWSHKRKTRRIERTPDSSTRNELETVVNPIKYSAGSGKKRHGSNRFGLPRFVPRIVSIKVIQIVVIVLVILAAAVSGWQLYENDELWLVDSVVVTNSDLGERALADVEIAMTQANGKNIFQFKSSQLVADIEKSPFVYYAIVQKRLPNTIEVTVSEALPETRIVSLNGARLIANNGQELFSIEGEQQGELSEIERQVYIEPRPFKNELLYERWLADNLDELRDRYSESTDANAGADSDADAITSDDSSDADNGSPDANLDSGPTRSSTGDESSPDEQFLKFNMDIFRSRSNQELAPYYNELRGSIVASVAEAWGANQDVEFFAGLDLDRIFTIYSLVDIEESDDMRLLVENKEYLEVLEEMQGFATNEIELVGLFTYRVKLIEQGVFGADSYAYFSTRKEISRQTTTFRLIALELESRDRQVTKIDLTGEKVVVS